MQASDLLDFLLTKVQLFKNFPQDKLKELVAASKITTFEGNEAVIKFGEEGVFLGVLISGQAEAAVTDNTGQKIRLAVLEAGDIFGEISLMTGNRTIASIIGITRCEAMLIPHSVFASYLLTQASTIHYLARIITERTAKWTPSHTAVEQAVNQKDDPYGLKLTTPHPAKLLIINCGSSSLKYSMFDTTDDENVVRGSIERIGSDSVKHSCKVFGKEIGVPVAKGGGHREAFLAMVECLTKNGIIQDIKEISALGHRIVHGGDKLYAPMIINDDVIAQIQEASAMAPLHNPVHLIGIREAQLLFPNVPHVAVFDTGFHHTMPPYAYMYGLPYEFYKQKKIRKYGFHGTSHFYVSLRAAEYLTQPFNALNIITCHLGNGSSICAIEHGRSIDTTMGFTPTDGLLMGTRTGSLDPSILIYLMRTEKMGVDELEKLVINQSGLKGLSGVSNDMREIEKAAMEGHHRALLAIKTFCYQIRKYIGSYIAAMDGLDVVVFTGGIGQGSAATRSLACQGLDRLGIEIDESKNQTINGFSGISDITGAHSRVRVLVVPTDEERMIARETIRSVSTGFTANILNAQKTTGIPIEVSAHHVHLAAEHVEILFGKGHQLTPAHDLSQHGQFACKETVNLIGPKGRVDRVRVLGPTRKETQVEIAMTEQFKLGVHPPIRESGDLDSTPGLTVEGTEGSVTLTKGVVCALRHIHMSTADALKLGLRDKMKVRVKVPGQRELVFGDVLIRVHPTFSLAMHIDTDEANAANIKQGTVGNIDSVYSND